MPLRISHGILITDKFFSLDHNNPAFERLVRHEFVPGELFPVIENFLTGGDPDHMIRRLSKDDAQTFIDVMDEVHYSPIRHWRSFRRDWC